VISRVATVPVWAWFLLFGRRLSWHCFGCWQAHEDTSVSAALPLRLLCSSSPPPPSLFPVIGTTRVGSVAFPQLQHLSCCFGVTQLPDDCAPGKPHTWMHSRSYTGCVRSTLHPSQHASTDYCVDIPDPYLHAFNSCNLGSIKLILNITPQKEV
jgi:hypothetical protein